MCALSAKLFERAHFTGSFTGANAVDVRVSADEYPTPYNVVYLSEDSAETKKSTRGLTPRLDIFEVEFRYVVLGFRMPRLRSWRQSVRLKALQ